MDIVGVRRGECLKEMCRFVRRSARQLLIPVAQRVLQVIAGGFEIGDLLVDGV